MSALRRFAFALALAPALLAAGCATQTTVAPSAAVTSQRIQTIAPERAQGSVTIGRSTRADVIAALGETLVIRFENGFEVWVYHLAGARRSGWFGTGRGAPGASGEFVLLFAPSGVVTKTRVRPAPAGG